MACLHRHQALEQLLRATNSYMGAVPDAARGGTLLRQVRRYFARVLGSFGLELLAAEGAAAAGGEGASAAAIAGALSTFRDDVRQRGIGMVKGGEGGAALAEVGKEVLALCDTLRDDVLPGVGMLVEDRPSGQAQYKLADPKQLLAEAERKREAAAAAAAEKEAKKAARAAQAALQTMLTYGYY